MFCVTCYMVEVVPAIIAKSFEELKKKIKLVEPYVSWVQLDVMDGKFAPEVTWPYFEHNCHPELVSGSMKMLKQVRHDNIKEDISRLATTLNFEAHLMVERPENEIDRWLDSGIKRILVHYEAIKDDLRDKIYDLRKKCDEKGVEFGIALNLETPIDVLGEICRCESADRRAKQSRGITARLLRRFSPCNDNGVIGVVQLMSIVQIGYHGEPFDGKVIPKIRALKEGYPCVKIAVDGGINKETAKMTLNAGADILVAGSAIFDSGDIEGAVKYFRDIY